MSADKLRELRSFIAELVYRIPKIPELKDSDISRHLQRALREVDMAIAKRHER